MEPLFQFPWPRAFKIGGIGNFVGAVGIIFYVIGILIFSGLFLLGGLQWLTSGGNKSTLEKARTRIMNALIGLSILGLGGALILILQAFFGLPIVGGDISPPVAYPQ